MNEFLLSVFIFLTTLLAFVVGYLISKLKKSDNAKKNVELQFQSLETKINNLQLEALESRLNPHLFKNVLNSIQSHAYQTYFALDKLGSVLDYILYESKSR